MSSRATRNQDKATITLFPGNRQQSSLASTNILPPYLASSIVTLQAALSIILSLTTLASIHSRIQIQFLFLDCWYIDSIFFPNISVKSQDMESSPHVEQLYNSDNSADTAHSHPTFLFYCRVGSFSRYNSNPLPTSCPLG
jgi:hypothetical protein